MKKRIVLGALMLSVVMIASCAETKETGVSETTHETTIEETSEVFERTAYERFLTNEETVLIDSRMDLEDSYLPLNGLDGQRLTLDELVKEVSEDYEDTVVGYAYLDCGLDGEPELLLRIERGSFCKYIMIKEFDGEMIKEFDGELKMIYAETQWDRYRCYYNEYGYIWCDGSCRANSHVFTKSYIDGDGKYHFVYSSHSESGFSNYEEYEYEYPLEINGEEIYVEDALGDGYYAFLDLRFGQYDLAQTAFTYFNYQKGEYDDGENGYQGYCYFIPNRDEDLYQVGNALYDLLLEHKIKVSSLDTIEQMIADREVEEGLTSEIKSGAVVEFMELEM